MNITNEQLEQAKSGQAVEIADDGDEFVLVRKDVYHRVRRGGRRVGTERWLSPCERGAVRGRRERSIARHLSEVPPMTNCGEIVGRPVRFQG